MRLLEAHTTGCALTKVRSTIADLIETVTLTSDHRLVDKLQSQVDQYRSIISRLYPGKYLENLRHLPRDELINLALTLPVPATPPSSDGDHMHPPDTISFDQQKASRAASLEALEETPDDFPELDEEKRHIAKVQGISDDVDGLSLVLDRQSSYVGV